MINNETMSLEKYSSALLMAVESIYSDTNFVGIPAKSFVPGGEKFPVVILEAEKGKSGIFSVRLNWATTESYKVISLFFSQGKVVLASMGNERQGMGSLGVPSEIEAMTPLWGILETVNRVEQLLKGDVPYAQGHEEPVIDQGHEIYSLQYGEVIKLMEPMLLF